MHIFKVASCPKSLSLFYTLVGHKKYVHFTSKCTSWICWITMLLDSNTTGLDKLMFGNVM